MMTTRQCALALTVAFVLPLAIARAQTPSLSTVNVTPESDKVRISAVGGVHELRVDVTDEAGEVVFESGVMTGDTLAWQMHDSQGNRVAPGAYTVTVTYRTAAGKLRKRVEQVTVTEEVTSAEKPETEAAPAPAPEPNVAGTGTTGRIAKWTNNTGTLGNSVITESAARIGINTAAPPHALSVSGGPPWTSSGWTGSVALPNTGAIGWNPNTAGQRRGLGHNNLGLFFFRTASNPGTNTSPALYDLVISNAGNVGVGTAVPASKLTVSGQIQILGAGNGIRFADGSIQTKATAGTINGTGAANRIAKFTGPNSFGNSSITEVSGNVGIGTTAPAGRLHVNGAQEGIRIQGPSTDSANLAYLSFVDSAGTAIGYVGDGSGGDKDVFLGSYSGNATLITSAGRVLVAAPSGNVGIGNLSPTSKLEVVGANISTFNEDNAVIKATNTARAGVAIRAIGGNSDSAFIAGQGLIAEGGDHSTSRGGEAIYAIGGIGSGAGNRGGNGIRALGGGFINGATKGPAGVFQGNVEIAGNLSKSSGSFKIDHPLDPENKYLYHSFVESPDMMNIYNGNVTTDARGLATVRLPAYFEALNRDFRYQLTVIGQLAQAVVAEKVKSNSFVIKTSAPGVEVSWQVTGIRRDPYANQNRIPVEEAKPQSERGTYIHPEAFGQPEERSLEWSREPELMRRLKERREKLQRETASPPGR